MASITSAGLLVAVGPGPVVVQALCEGVSKTALTTLIPKPVASVEATPSTASVRVGETVQLNATARAADGTVLDRPVTWTSSDASVASVSATCIVTGVSGARPPSPRPAAGRTAWLR